MKLVKISDLFNVEYGNNIELNRLNQVPNGINFVSRTAKNNGVSAKVKRIKNIEPTPAGTITVSLGGSVLETFVQPKSFYSGYHIFCLLPKLKLTVEEKLFYCTCIYANKYRYNYGRQANKTLKDLLIPDKSEIPLWTNETNIHRYNDAYKPFINKPIPMIEVEKWKSFQLNYLFNLEKGKRLTKANMIKGNIPFIGSINNNNGYSELIGQKPIHLGNTITVNYNGSVAEAFYQPKPFWASDDVNVLYPKFELNQYIAMFIITLIKQEKYRFNYGRKWILDRMNESIIKLPVDENNEPNWQFMEDYIKSLPYSSSIN